MIAEQELKDRCTPEFIKWVCEHAEGFEFIQCENNYFSISVNKQEYGNIITDEILFPFLIHRAIEWIKIIYSDSEKVWYNNIYGMQCFRFKNYQPKSLTHAECAMLHCLIDVFKTGGER